MYDIAKKVEWTKKLTEKLGYKPYFWDGIQHSRDQLIGILRELEDGHDPWGGERHKQSVEFALRHANSKRLVRDDRDEQLGDMVDNGSWVNYPESPMRSTFGKSLPPPKPNENDEVVELNIYKRLKW